MHIPHIQVKPHIMHSMHIIYIDDFCLFSHAAHIDIWFQVTSCLTWRTLINANLNTNGQGCSIWGLSALLES